jgi:hypothetical protein
MSFTRNVKVKEVNTFYFFNGGFGSNKFRSGRGGHWCIIGSAQLPYHEDSFKRMKKNELFLQKNNVFYIGSSILPPIDELEPKLPKYSEDSALAWMQKEMYKLEREKWAASVATAKKAAGNHPWHTPLESENRIHENTLRPNKLYMNELQEEALVITCEKCNSPPFYSCRTPVKGYNCKTHAIRKSGVQQILFVGKRRTGPGSYYYHRKKMYLAENLDDVTEFISNPDEKNESRTSRKSIPDDVQIFVWKRDGGLCVKCGSNENLAFDHIIPHSLGGSDTRRNLQILCDTCNSKKGNKIGG